MDFAWSKEQIELRDAARALGASLNAGLIERDREGTFDRGGWQKLAELGIQGLPVPRAKPGRHDASDPLVNPRRFEVYLIVG
jgi:alkylation response protein AidB-like acyl-CoA dehydrogenase